MVDTDCRKVHIKNILIKIAPQTLIKPAQQVESTVLTQLEVLCQNRYF